ncbi:MAG: hypothetical protein KAJ40_04480 [Alphaproteobacteria bacterium]|nr:hypothetical protein [Alphaproteobacteria bacterium]
MEIINSSDLLNYAPVKPNYSDYSMIKMVKSERTAGYIPSYDSFLGPSSTNNIQDKAFEKLVQEQLDTPDDVYTLSLDEQKIENTKAQENQDRFDIFDLIDMVNPLQHIPVINYAYRSLTGDNIKSISAIIGGAVFAGPIGAASGLVTAVLKQETSGSLPETVLSITSKENTEQKIAAYKTASDYMDANNQYNT